MSSRPSSTATSTGPASALAANLERRAGVVMRRASCHLCCAGAVFERDSEPAPLHQGVPRCGEGPLATIPRRSDVEVNPTFQSDECFRSDRLGSGRAPQVPGPVASARAAGQYQAKAPARISRRAGSSGWLDGATAGTAGARGPQHFANSSSAIERAVTERQPCSAMLSMPLFHHPCRVRKRHREA